jgi:hypothetical protein
LPSYCSGLENCAALADAHARLSDTARAQKCTTKVL